MEVGRARPITPQTILTRAATGLTQAGGDTDSVRIHRRGIGYGVDRRDHQQGANNPDYI